MLAGDLDRLEQLWDDGLIMNTASNAIVTKPDVLRLLQAGQIYRSLDRTTEIVRVIGEITIVMGQEVVVPSSGTPGGGETITRRYTHVWVRHKDQWRLAARHASVVTDTPA
jgi:ketosteroid isomerase-like protein